MPDFYEDQALKAGLEELYGAPEAPAPVPVAQQYQPTALGLLRDEDAVVLAYHRDSLPQGSDEWREVQGILERQPVIAAEVMPGIWARLSPMIDRDGLTAMGQLQAASVLSNLRQRRR